MVRQRNVDKFNHNVKDLWKYLSQIFKDNSKIKQLLSQVLRKHHKMDDIKYLEYVLKNLAPYITRISRRDEFIFTPEFGDRSLNFLIGLDFRQIWKTHLSLEQKRVIFRYLEFLYLQSSLALNTNQAQVKKIIESIQTEQDIEQEAAENPDMFAEQDGTSGGLPDFMKLFGEDNILMDLVKDMQGELNLEEMLGELLSGNGASNPMEAIQNMSNNPKMMEMMSGLQEKVNEKMLARNVTQEELMASADNLRTGLMEGMGSMPGGKQIKKMMKNLDFEKLESQLGQNGDNPPNAHQFLQQMMGDTTTEKSTMPVEVQELMQNLQQMNQSGQSPEELQAFFQKKMINNNPVNSESSVNPVNSESVNPVNLN